MDCIICACIINGKIPADYWWAYDIAYQATEDSAYKINEDFAKQPIKKSYHKVIKNITNRTRILNSGLYR